MKLKDFITSQRVGIFAIGLIAFALSLLTARRIGYTTIWGELLIDLASAAITVIFTTLIIDYLGVREELSKTRNATGLAEDEIKSICFRLKWRMARLYSMKRDGINRDEIESREQARDYLKRAEQDVNTHLEKRPFENTVKPLDASALPKFLERLQRAKEELEQTLLLYEYAMGYTLRERVLTLRTELQIADNILGFLDVSDTPSDAATAMIRVLSASIYDATESVLGHNSTTTHQPIHAKESRIA
jgi:hypothetical protein